MYREWATLRVRYAAVLKGILDTSARDQMNVEGMLTWASEFEGQRILTGPRTLTTNGVDEPIGNLLRMLA